MPNRLPILAVLAALLLAACSSKDDASNGISIASAPPAEATAITATVTARSQSGTAAAVATVVAPANVLTPRPGVQADIVAARRLESEGDIHGASEAYVAVASRQDRDSGEAVLVGLTGDDLVIFLVSGGGSALFEKPLDHAITLADLVEFNRVLVTGGLPIEQINVLRKHLSAVKGGRLAIQAHPARQLTIFVSDVPEDLPSMVASGPTMPDESTAQQCYSIAEQHGLASKFPPSVRKHYTGRTLEETPKPGDARFENSRYYCLLSNRDAVEAAQACADRLGFTSEIERDDWDRDYQDVAGGNLAALDRLAQASGGQPVCLVVGGEVTCPVTGPGTGGRNQAFVLYAAQQIQGQRRVVLSAGTDGRDGNSPVGGSLADGQTLSRARARGLDPAHFLAASDSYHFFRALGDTIETGFTDNNVRDVRLWLDFGSGSGPEGEVGTRLP